MSSAITIPAALTGPTRHLFLSPHYDDIPLSVGGTVRLLANYGHTPKSLVVFGSEPDADQPLTPFARSLHDAWGLEANAVIASRRAEENAASAILGAETGVLPFRDAIYRGSLYRSDDDLFGTPNESESTLPSRIAAALKSASTPDQMTRIYAPLGVGRHVDHQTAFLAALSLAETGWDVWFYEDVPYALKPNAFDSRFAEIAATTPIESVAQIPVESTWDDKLDAIMSYPSQLETVFRTYVGVGTSRVEIAQALGVYARSLGAGERIERFWRLANPSRSEGS